MIADASGNGVPNVQVRIRWRGAANGAQTGTTDASGLARFVSPSPTSSKKLFLVEVPRVTYRGATQRPRAFARSGSGFGSLALNLSLSGLLASLGSTTSSTDGLTIWGSGGSGIASATTGSGCTSSSSGGSGIASATTGSDCTSGSTGSGIASATTGSTGTGSSSSSSPSYPLTLNVNACPLGLLLYSYNLLSFTASQKFFSGALLASGYSARTIDSSWVLAPGAVAFDQNELGLICGLLTVAQVKPMSTSYFTSGTLYTADGASPPAGQGAGDVARLWSEVMFAEGSTAP
jgi:hypothetical protein